MSQMERTCWFKYDQSPSRVGWYECSSPKCDKHYWDGKRWFRGKHGISYKIPLYFEGTTHKWRGVTESSYRGYYESLS